MCRDIRLRPDSRYMPGIRYSQDSHCIPGIPPDLRILNIRDIHCIRCTRCIRYSTGQGIGSQVHILARIIHDYTDRIRD